MFGRLWEGSGWVVRRCEARDPYNYYYCYHYYFDYFYYFYFFGAF